jgi:two-component system, OmpR family, sensor kinase
MAGGKEQMRMSIQRRLSIGLSGAIVFTAVFSCALTFWLALDEAHELQDATLSQIAHVINYSSATNSRLNKTVQKMEGENDTSISMEFITADGMPHANSDIAFQLPRPIANGFQEVNANGQRYRVLVYPLSPQLRLAIGQRTEVRNDIAFDSALRTLIPLVLLLPILLLVTRVLIRRSFAPLRRLAEEVDHRDDNDLTPFEDQQIPQEILPFLTGINKLLSKVDGTLQTQKRFIADAAHELRTPLTALSLQIERLADAQMSPDAQARLVVLRQGLTRAKTLVEQLLSLARAQQSPQRRDNEPLQVGVLFREVIESLYPLAAEKSVDIGMVPVVGPERPLFVDKEALSTALKNLTENAIRYIPERGQIDLRASFTAHSVMIDVEDNGPGIADAERERVFDAFYRPEGTTPPGSGLGLSIVKACVSRLGGAVTLHPARHFATGLLVRITLPAATK